MRLFFGLEPDQQSKQQIDLWRQQFVTNINHVVARDNFHITLVFLGHTPADKLQALSSMADRISSLPVDICLNQIDCWPKPKVLFLRAQQQSDRLNSLAAKLQQGCRQLGLAIDKREYIAHLTLARKTQAIPALSQDAYNALNFNLQFQHFCLFESVSKPDGVRYHVRLRWPLKVNQAT
ncbi:RNA 2',3'-cyclic phosphodiesterase [Thalassotalea ponticola]|uniref:RNA 2',3'-cyclic phosphodiesterase n=1 Tax=Thalassotalea ponticola TaxID=1523392 RepID=UPI0025B3F153|nr:RNA 2',3'-cyclic phosphodiesterase [Thalassotalea ponticola]MDN3653474.1 RNA 2',3'-cyclic phosphodiesterase [Thalassotalea ponticola]